MTNPPNAGGQSRTRTGPHASPSASVPVAVFDIDGTLLRSARLDEECWLEAFVVTFGATLGATFGISEISTDWGSYEHSTDRAILDEVIRTHLRRQMTEADEALMIDRFVETLERRIAETPDDLSVTPGARELMTRLRERGWAVAIGTGGWRRSATLKLDRAGFDITDVPAAYAEDGPARERIIETAVERALPGEGPKSVIYFGDGAWDVRASSNVGAGFIGIGSGDAAKRLHTAGATRVFEDFVDAEAILSAIDRERAR